jgi:hypothetical protein
MKYRVPDLVIPADDPFRFDALKRRPIVEFLGDFLRRIEGPFVLALDSPWGTGKTTVIRMLQATLAQKSVQCVYFNAWKVDYVSDPLVALVSAIDELKLDGLGPQASFRSHMNKVKKVTTAIAKRGAVAAVKAATLGALDLKEEFEGIVADAAGETTGDLVDVFQRDKATLDTFRLELEGAVSHLMGEGKAQTLVFFVDELDRCRPSFAIEMLERIKHLFDVHNIVFVLSVDKSQLEASTAAVYGEKINAPEYLRRFIDLEFGLPPVDSKALTKTLLARFEFSAQFEARAKISQLKADESQFTDSFSALADIFSLSLRARERCITRLAVILDQTASNEFLDPILVAFLIIVRIKNPRLFEALSDGRSGSNDAMAFLEAQSGGAELRHARLGQALECYLIAGDANSARQSAKREQLTNSANNEADTTAGIRARELLGMQQLVPPHMFNRGRFDLKTIAARVDIAARTND